VIPGHILVRVQPGVDAGRLANDYKTVILDHPSGTNLYSFRVPSTTTETTFAAKVRADARVMYTETDNYVVSPEVGGEPFHFAFDLSSAATTFVNSATYVQVGMGEINSNNVGTKPAYGATGKGIVIAVLDTGATFTHKDLVGHYLIGYNAIQPGLPPNEAADGFANYEVGHGTMIAGIIARLAPQAKIMPIRVLNGDGSGSLLNLVKGVRYATNHGANVISMSFGVSIKSSALDEALGEAQSAGITLVASAGNDNRSDMVVSPTVTRGTIPVAAVDANNKKSSFSNYGSFVKVSAPGANIRSTYYNGGYASWSGTSFAAPFVAAEAALILSVKPTLSSGSVESIIRNTARDIDSVNPAYKGKLGKGVIDIASAVRMAVK
jgi:subtilisin family serine protease